MREQDAAILADLHAALAHSDEEIRWEAVDAIRHFLPREMSAPLLRPLLGHDDRAGALARHAMEDLAAVDSLPVDESSSRRPEDGDDNGRSAALARMHACRLYERGWNLMQRGQLEATADSLEESTRYSTHAMTFERLGDCYLRLKRYREAVQPLAAATALKNHARPATLLAEAFLALGEYSDARRAAELALARHPQTRRAREILEEIAANE